MGRERYFLPAARWDSLHFALLTGL